jgi:GNAT superfamily N-acetyltransferase
MSFEITPATLDHLDTIVEHRRSMFFDMGHRDEAVLDRMSAAFRPWVAGKIAGGEYRAWFATVDGAVAGGVGLWVMDWLPHLIATGAPRGNIVNVYTCVEFRRRGIARALISKALAWCKEYGITYVILHASPEGRPIYESMGFRATNEMRILL